MAPIPPNMTPVLFVDYQFNGEQHTFQLRSPLGGVANDLVALAQDIVDEIDVLACTGWEVLGTRFRQAGSDLSVPSGAVTIGSAGGGALNPVQNPRFVSWIGRGGTSGRRTRLFIYGLVFTTPEDYRLTGSENAVMASVRNLLQTAAENNIVATVANDQPFWYEYQNVGFNSYWEREQRV